MPFRRANADLPLTPIESVLDYAVGLCSPLQPISLPTAEAAGLVLAADALANSSVPPFDNSAMDGFAVRANDMHGSTTLTLRDTIEAGSSSTHEPLPPNHADVIMTGGMVPAGADAVVPFERVDNYDDTSVTISAPPQPGANIRKQGDDLRAGETVLAAGTRLQSAQLAALVACGVTSTSAYPRPRVSVITTGNELGATHSSGIPDSNSVYLQHVLAEKGFTVARCLSVADDTQTLINAITAASENADAIITTGGVGPGARDLIVDAVKAIGDITHFHVAMKPGKPFAAGTVDANANAVPIFCLPGNPVSTMVSFHTFVLPALQHLGGSYDFTVLQVQACTEAAIPKRPDGKVHILRGKAIERNGEWTVRPVAHQGSHQLVSSAEANCFIRLTDGNGVSEGDTVLIQLLA